MLSLALAAFASRSVVVPEKEVSTVTSLTLVTCGEGELLPVTSVKVNETDYSERHTTYLIML